MELDQQLLNTTREAFKQIYGADVPADKIQVEETRKDFTGDRTVIIFPLLKYAKEKPEEAGQKTGQYLVDHLDFVNSFEVIKGFVNLNISNEFWQKYLTDIHKAKAVPVQPHEHPQTIMVEYSSPNTNKPQHLGHVRNNLLGYSISEIFKVRGHNVIKANLINDRGIHICKSMIAWMKYGEGETPESTGIKGDQLVGRYYVKFDEVYNQEIETLVHQGADAEEAKREAPILKEAQELLRKWEQGDEKVMEIWQMMNDWVYQGFEATYKRLGVDFDKYYYESETYKLGKDPIQEGVDKGVFYRKDDGSVWVDLTDEGLDEKLVLRSDGTAVYITQDLGTAQLKYDDYKLDQSIYVVGNEQDYHFKVLALILKKLGKSYADGIYHLSYGMVDLPSGKMKSREGTVVDADDLMDEMEATAEHYAVESNKLVDIPKEVKQQLYRQIGTGALKYFILKSEPKKRMLFDPEASIDFQGDTGPFIQYTHARIRSVMRKAAEAYNVDELSLDSNVAMETIEKELIRQMYKFSEKVAEAERTMAPSVITHYAFELARTFNKFYHECPILGKNAQPEVQKFRIVLSLNVGRYLAKALALLGIHAPERM